MSLKLKFHLNWNFTETSLKLKCHFNGYALKLKFHPECKQNWNVTQILLTKKSGKTK